MAMLNNQRVIGISPIFSFRTSAPGTVGRCNACDADNALSRSPSEWHAVGAVPWPQCVVPHRAPHLEKHLGYDRIIMYYNNNNYNNNNNHNNNNNKRS